MELIVINENKLKIICNETDMKVYGINENEFHCSLMNTRRVLDKILQQSPIQTGFENISSKDKILIQLYPEKNGGCELYITKITLDDKEDMIFMPQENEEKYLLPKSLPKKQIKKSPIISYRFERLEHGICAAKELILRNFSSNSSFYQGLDGKFYLILNIKHIQSNENNAQIDFLSEFGENSNIENTLLMLTEYGKCIFKDNAIESLAEI